MAENQEQQQNRGFGKQRQGGRPQRGRREDEWKPVTKLGRLVKAGKIESLEEIFRWAMPIKESQIVDAFLPAVGPNDKPLLREECMQVKPVQKQTTAGQRMRFKAYVVIGDCNGHIGLGWCSNKEVQGAIKGAVTHAKLNLVPVRRGYWGNMIGDAHTVPTKVHGKSGSVRIRMIPAPRGTGIVAAPASKKVIQFAGIGDVYTCSSGCTRTRGNFVKATYYCLENTYKYFTPDWRGRPEEERHPFDAHTEFLSQKPEEKRKYNRD